MAKREVSVLGKCLRRGDWGNRDRPTQRSIIIDACFNCGGLRSRYWMSKYLEYLQTFYPDASSSRTNAKPTRFLSGNHVGRDSDPVATRPILTKKEFKPVRVMLIRGKAELLLVTDN